MISIILLLRSAHITGNKTGSWSNILVETCVQACVRARTHTHKLQALVYDIIPSTTAVFSYATFPENCEFFVGAQTIVSLLQTTKIKQGVSFTATNKVYTSTNKTTFVWIEMELFFLFLSGVDAFPCLHACLGARLLPQSC